ncbi:MAG: hypothetical protein H0W78_18785 [Planctomycetes bacterium]|nr:hypothetical protein [Planctomycetota bacterium]
MYTKDLERIVRSMARQKLDPTYIRYYLIETYQLDPKTIDEVFASLGVGATKEKFNTKSSPLSGGAKPAAPRKPFS